MKRTQEQKRKEIERELNILKGCINAGLNALYYNEIGTYTDEKTDEEIQATINLLTTLIPQLIEVKHDYQYFIYCDDKKLSLPYGTLGKAENELKRLKKKFPTMNFTIGRTEKESEEV